MFHRNWVNDVKFFHQDKLVVSCSRDSYVQVFDCCSGKCVIKYNLSPGNKENKIKTILNKKIKYFNIFLDYAETLALKEEYSIAVGTEHGSVQVFDLRALKAIQKYNEHTSKINCVQYQHGTPCLVSVSKDKQLNVILFNINI